MNAAKITIALGFVALAYFFGSEEPIRVHAVQAGDGTWRFVATKGSKSIFEDGPFASQEAAQTAADNWLAGPGAALGCAGGGTACSGKASLGARTRDSEDRYAFGRVVTLPLVEDGPRARLIFRTASLGQPGHVGGGIRERGGVRPYSIAQLAGGVGIDIRDMHGMYVWAKDIAPSLGITPGTPAGVALRKLARAITGGQDPVAINFGTFGDDEWPDVLEFVRKSVRPFSWNALLQRAHDRLHQLGYSSLEEAGITGVGRVPRGGKLGGFIAKPGKPVAMLDLGTCAVYEGSRASQWICCKDHEGRYSCMRLRTPEKWGPRLPSQPSGHTFTSGSTSPGPGPGETGVNAGGGLYTRTRGERRL